MDGINDIELGLAGIVLIGYIVGKLWVYHNTTKGGKEWAED